MATRSIWQHKMPALAWRLHWWLISRMDQHQEVHGGWRAEAGRFLGGDRATMSRNGQALVKAGLIQTARGSRTVKVLVNNIMG